MPLCSLGWAGGGRRRTRLRSHSSCFPNESEILFPPLTYLEPTGQREEVRLDGATFTIVEVKPGLDATTLMPF